MLQFPKQPGLRVILNQAHPDINNTITPLVHAIDNIPHAKIVQCLFSYIENYEVIFWPLAAI